MTDHVLISESDISAPASFQVSPNDITDVVRLEAASEANKEAASNTKRVQFSFSKDSFTPSVERITNNALKPPVLASNAIAPPSTMVKPNYEDILRRVSVVLYQHIDKCESQLKNNADVGTLFDPDKLELFSEESFLLPKYCYDFTTMSVARLGFQYSLRRLKPYYNTQPSLNDIHCFLRDVFVKARLTPECSIGNIPCVYVCLC